MKRLNKFTGFSLLTASMLILNLSSLAQAQYPPPAGLTVLTYQNRLYLNGAPPTEVLVAFYFTDIAGVPSPLVEYAGSDAIQAYFTALYDNTGAIPVANGDVSTVVFIPGHRFNVYFNSTPGQSWSNPASFASGELVATFESSIGTSASTPPPPNTVITNVTQSYILKWSKNFVFRGKTYNFRHLIPNGFTTGNVTSGTANFPALAAGFPIVSAAAGSFVAVGGPWSAPWRFEER